MNVLKHPCISLMTWELFTTTKYYSTSVKTSHKWKSVIGLEIHAQISSSSKLFSGSKCNFGAPVNTCVSLFDTALPGTLPILNKRCVEVGIMTALALGCHINSVSMFDRKHYFYADLPAGYQITQQRKPLAINGHLTFPVIIPGENRKPYRKSVKIRQLQLEQDSGKSLHDDVEKRSLVDLNRAGIPLMELVFDPDLESGEEAASLVKELILILRKLNACSCHMEEGSLRVDANVSLHEKDQPLGVRTEIKNIGSVRNIAQAIEYEIKRQADILDFGGNIVNETRVWDAAKKKTISMRDKEVLQDYRFMPESNLPPLHLDLDGSSTNTLNSNKNNLIQVEKIKSKLPELPEQTRRRLKDEFHLTDEISIRMVSEEKLLKIFLKMVYSKKNINSKVVTNFLLNDFLALCNKHDENVDECKISFDQITQIIDLIESKKINIYISRIILQELFENPEESPNKIMISKNLTQINDLDEIEKLCKKSIEQNPKAVTQYKNGKKKALFAIAGDIAKLSNQRANMELAIKKLEELLKYKSK